MLPELTQILVLVCLIVGAIVIRRGGMWQRCLFDAIAFLVVSGLLFEGAISPLSRPAGITPQAVDLLAILLTAWWILCARLIVYLPRLLSWRHRSSRQSKLFSDLSAAAIFLVTGFIVLNSVFDVPVKGLLATSGVLAIVLGLALQNTLSDVFSGIAVDIESPFGLGDDIELDGKTSGQVIEVNWRSIHIQTDTGDIAIVPNTLVAKSQMVNRSRPTPRRSGSVSVTCANAIAPEQILELLRQAALLCPLVLQDPKASIGIAHIGAKRMTYTLSFFVSTPSQIGAAKSQLFENIHRQLQFSNLLTPPQRSPDQVNDGPEKSFVTPDQMLLATPLFACLSGDLIRSLAKSVVARHLEPGQILFKQGDSDASLFMIAFGLLEVSTEHAQGEALSLGYLGAGESLGEVALVTGEAYSVTATARAHCLVYALSSEALIPLIKGDENLAGNFEKAVQASQNLIQRKIATYAASMHESNEPLIQRIRHFLRIR
ncbi:cyclic nucleotide-binding domain-containing protein [Rhodanobacter sp. MP7CTX1]|uniref:cyclic nucleotide-binding domain-containing protein n=1 Tax=Rhodanobacter sp. MP7CTX1 TaxID=2723084 RepID=UPI0016204F3B|nr:cyclic nucleotide-binding domain-containing protein [Rhodanobacter sp. MP7CTX1]MBB6186020.1 small-conductance mechanosensitive channel/CRP-like cAMP-binding protein [Rhodanobacter sp. MP7CTX1]